MPIAGEIDDRVVRLAYKPKADDGQNGRHTIDGDAKGASSVVVPAFPIADDALVLRVGKKRIEKVREPSDVKHDDDTQQNEEDRPEVPGLSLHDEDHGDHEERGRMHRGCQKDEDDGRRKLLLQDKAGRCEADRDRNELADAVEHPRIIVCGCNKKKQGEDKVLRVFSEKMKEQKPLNDGKNQKIDMDVGADKCADQGCQCRKALVL